MVQGYCVKSVLLAEDDLNIVCQNTTKKIRIQNSIFLSNNCHIKCGGKFICIVTMKWSKTNVKETGSDTVNWIELAQDRM
jgi:hypothetical protein